MAIFSTYLEDGTLSTDHASVQLYMLYRMPTYGYYILALILSVGGLGGSTLFVDNVLGAGVPMLEGRKEIKTSWCKELVAGINIVILYFFGLLVLYMLPRMSNLSWGAPSFDAATMWGIVLAPFVSLLLNDLLYWIYHGAVHKNRTLYRWVHFMHHEIRTPTGGALDTYYEHPLDFIFGTACALAPLAIVPQMHIFGVFVHLLSNTVIAIADHSGRDINAGWIFSAADHDIHHRFGYGNFAQNFSIVDHLFGTHINLSEKRAAEAAADLSSPSARAADVAELQAAMAAEAAAAAATAKKAAAAADLAAQAAQVVAG